MAFLLDTCALSELVAKRQNPHAVEAILALPEEWFISVATVGEIRRGIEELDEGPRRHFLETWYQEQVIGIYFHKIIVYDIAEAAEWGRMVALLRRKRMSMSIVDSVIAATALTHGHTLVTRNEAHFVHTGVKILNPWK